MRKELIAYKDPKSPVSEIFRTLRTNVQFMNSNKNLNTLLITSTLPGEGKTWISSNLAIAFAQTGQRVVLIDADMRKCSLHNTFGVAPCPGLSNYLSGVNDDSQQANNLYNYLRKTEVQNLYLMPAGNVPPNPSELLINPQMANLLQELKVEFDLIIIDGTPSKLVTDSVILSRIVDSTIVVAAHNYAKKDDLKKVVRDIKNVGGNIAGIVYNKKPVSAKKVNENYYYSSGKLSLQPKSNMEFKYEKERNHDVDEQKNNMPEGNKNTENSEGSGETVKFRFEDFGVKNSVTSVTDTLKEINEYLQREKDIIENNRS